MVLCVVHALYVGIRSLTLTRKPFTPTYFIRVSCHTIMFGPSTEKEGMEDSEEEEDDDNYVPPEYGDAAMGGAGEDQEEQDDVPNDAATGEAAEDQEEPDDVPDDDRCRVIVDAKRQCESVKETMKFDRMLEDHKKGLYPNCEDGNTKLGTVWNCCSGRQRMLCLTKDLRSY